MTQIIRQMNPITLLSQKHGIKRMGIMTMSILLMGFSVSVFSYSGMGVDPYTALNMSVSEILGISFGFWQMCLNGAILVLVGFVSKKLISVGTVFNMIGVGYVCEFFTNIYDAILPAEKTFLVRIICMALGVFLLSLSASLYFNCNLGVSPYDALGFVMEEKTKLKYKWCRVATDLICTASAIVMGGPVGVGTVVTAFFMGPVVSFCDNTISKKVMKHRFKLLRNFMVIRYYDYSYLQGANRVA